MEEPSRRRTTSRGWLQSAERQEGGAKGSGGQGPDTQWRVCAGRWTGRRHVREACRPVLHGCGSWCQVAGKGAARPWVWRRWGDANTTQRQFKHHRRQQEAETTCLSISGALLESNDRLEQKTARWQGKQSSPSLEGGLVCLQVSGGT